MGTARVRRVLGAALAAALAACAAPAPQPVADQPRASGPPLNLVLIVADDLGWTDLASFGSTFHETPNLDRMAREGLRFTSFYAASPVCSPTRASLMTGRHPARVQVTDWSPGRTDRPDQRLLQVRDRNELPLAEVTLAEVLRGAGYATASIGKWHLGGPGHLPTDQGFDLNVAGDNAGSPPGYFWPYQTSDRGLSELAARGRPGDILTDRLAEEAAQWISSNRDRPFFLYLPFFAVHTPLQAKPELVAKYRAKAAALEIPDSAVWGTESGRRFRRVQSHATYAGMVETLDAAVGRVLRALEESGVAGRTLVVFTSDNGGLATAEGWPTTNLPLRAGKGWLYEGGLRVPTVVRWPGEVEPGREHAGAASSMDLFPTLLDAAGIRWEAGRLDGVSLLPVLRGGSLTRDTLFWHYPHYSNQGGRPGGAVRQNRWKLIEHFEDGRVELYDLATDPGETRDLSATQAARAAALRASLHRWRASVGAQMPLPNPAYSGSAAP